MKPDTFTVKVVLPVSGVIVLGTSARFSTKHGATTVSDVIFARDEPSTAILELASVTPVVP